MSIARLRNRLVRQEFAGLVTGMMVVRRVAMCFSFSRVMTKTSPAAITRREEALMTRAPDQLLTDGWCE